MSASSFQVAGFFRFVAERTYLDSLPRVPRAEKRTPLRLPRVANRFAEDPAQHARSIRLPFAVAFRSSLDFQFSVSSSNCTAASNPPGKEGLPDSTEPEISPFASNL